MKQSWSQAILIIFYTTLFVLPGAAQRGLYDLPNPFEFTVQTSSSMALTRGGRIIVSNPLAQRVSIINLQGTLDAELNIGKNPRGVFILSDHLRALAVAEDNMAILNLETNEIDQIIQFSGQADGVVATEESAYIALYDSAEIIEIDLSSGRIREHISTPDHPSGLALWGDFLYVTHRRTGELSLIYLPAAEVVRTIHTHPQASLSYSVEIDPVNGRAFLPQSLINEDGTPENRIIPVVHIIDLRTMQVEQMLNLIVADRAVSVPISVTQPSNRSRLYIAYAGSNDVSVLNLDTGTADHHLETGANPGAIRFNRDFTRIYVQDVVAGTISVFDTNFFGLQDQIPSHSQPIAPLQQIGAQLFYTARDTRLSATSLLSCASCHYKAPFTSSSITPQALNQHIQEVTGGSGLEENSVDIEALLSYIQEK